MNDDRRADRLARYLDGTLPPGDAGEVERLISASPEWQADLDLLRRAREAVKRSAPWPSPGVWPAVAAALAEEPGASLWAHLDWAGRKLVPYAAAAAVALFAASHVVDGQDDSLSDYAASQESAILAEADDADAHLADLGE